MPGTYRHKGASPTGQTGQRPLLRRAAQALGLLGVVALVVTAETWLAAIGRWLTYPPNAQAADVIAVYGGGRERTMYGSDLYQRELAPELWHTGYPKQRASVVALLTKRGLPRETIHYLSSHNTWEDGQAIATFAKQRHVQHILVVTSWFHSRRAICTIKRQLAGSGIEVSYDVPPARGGGPNDWWKRRSSRRQILSELIKLPYYWLRYGVAFWNC
jgi:uncharacterized SAM-binding protein YcdF (DUF218 family)